MGIDYRAAVMVGLPQSEIANAGLIDDETLEVCPPYYDGDGAPEAIAGFCYEESGRYTPSELEWCPIKIDELKRKFRGITGQDARVWLTPRGY